MQQGTILASFSLFVATLPKRTRQNRCFDSKVLRLSAKILEATAITGGSGPVFEEEDERDDSAAFSVA
jgi:hypothetical protein